MEVAIANTKDGPVPEEGIGREGTFNKFQAFGTRKS